MAAAVCYLLRPDVCAVVTIWPTWFWVLPGLVLAALGWNRRGRRVVGGVAALWLVYLLIFAEEPRSLLHYRSWPTAEWEQARAQGRAVRVVSLNSAGGDLAAAAEVARYHPDIVLLQESPTRRQVQELARQLFGKEAGVAWNYDGSIAARGRLLPIDLPVPKRVAVGRVRLPDGFEANVVSIRLHSPVLEVALWSRESWSWQARNRRKRMEQMEGIRHLVAALPDNVPLILGGDFNAPAGDAVYRYLRPRLHDTFAEGGIGWGNTAFNDFPVLRVDEIWVSERLRAAAVVARRTVHSDHRMVVCDLVVK